MRMRRFVTLLGLSAVFISLSITPAFGDTVIVPAIPLWTDTGIALSAGDIVTITASGTWCWAGGSCVGPDGDNRDRFDTWVPSAPADSLIGFIGGSMPTSPFSGGFGVGSSITFVAAISGELWLGINDDYVSGGVGDNSGFLTADINVVPEPSTLMLLGSGAVGLLGVIRRKLSV